MLLTGVFIAFIVMRSQKSAEPKKTN